MHSLWPAIMDKNKTGVLGLFWKAARIGERLSPYVSIACILIGINQFFG
ncbi:DEKNAAC102108 [Brettanomyces naardenensis]|uniref:Protein kish n=1 Tax=Brettanomyces naardenensis TaxID=13370 RepID=A0A448YJN9_BRENA|nr:DEKNAAC102108 [Brettanomyces naardenensis]